METRETSCSASSSNADHKLLGNEPPWRSRMRDGYMNPHLLRQLWPTWQELIGLEGPGNSRVPSLLISASDEVLCAWCLAFPLPGAAWDFPTSHTAGVNRALSALWALGWYGWRRCSIHQPGACHGPCTSPLLAFSMPGKVFHCAH